MYFIHLNTNILTKGKIEPVFLASLPLAANIAVSLAARSLAASTAELELLAPLLVSAVSAGMSHLLFFLNTNNTIVSDD